LWECYLKRQISCQQNGFVSPIFWSPSSNGGKYGFLALCFSCATCWLILAVCTFEVHQVLDENCMQYLKSTTWQTRILQNKNRNFPLKPQIHIFADGSLVKCPGAYQLAPSNVSSKSVFWPIALQMHRQHIRYGIEHRNTTYSSLWNL
jgi:hypothetical protein